MIYIAAPYSDPDKEVVNRRVSLVCKYSALLLKKDLSNVSPILIGTSIFLHATLPSDFAFWQKMSYDLLSRCDALYVMKIDGWKDSIGVQAEISFAKQHNIKIEYVDVDHLIAQNLI